MKRSLQGLLAISLILAPPIHADGEAPAPSCAKSEADLKKDDDTNFNTASTGLTAPSNILNECHQATQDLIHNCAIEGKDHLPECTKVETPGSGMAGAFDSQIKTLVHTANCDRGLGHCYHYQPSKQDKNLIVEKCSKSVDSARATAPPEAAADNASIKKYADSAMALVVSQYKCWRGSGDQAETDARNLLKSSQASKSGTEEQAIDCMDTSNGNRTCAFQEKGGSHLKELDENKLASSDQNGNGPVHLMGSDCSGTVLGDGQTVVTAGHCYNKDTAGEPMQIHDASGNLVNAVGNCKPNIGHAVQKPDFAVCTLDKPVSANPVYLATYDPSVKGDTCNTTGYVMRCGDGFYEGLSNKQMHMLAYPYRVDETTQTVKNNMVYTYGTVNYETTTHNIYVPDEVCTGGCSGGGYMMDIGGKQVLVAAHGYSNRFIPGQGGASVIPADQFDALTVQSVSTDKLGEGTLLFSQMPM